MYFSHWPGLALVASSTSFFTAEAAAARVPRDPHVPRVTSWSGGSYGAAPVPTLPASCFSTFGPAGIEGPTCFTYTSTTVPATCPDCPENASLVCPLLIRITTTTVPCATDCCPTTTTAAVDGACPPCGVCIIPTETFIETSSGCATATETPQCWIPEGCPATI